MTVQITDPAGFIQAIIDKSLATLALQDKELLRVYWYDGVANSLTPQQRALVAVNDVQLRAGTINGVGQQKGVDSLIVTDLIELTSHHAVCDAVLVTGDSDLAVGIELAQRRGVRVAVIGVEDVASGVLHNQSFEITSRADRVACLGSAELTAVLRYAPVSTAASATATPQRPAASTNTPSAPAPTPTVGQVDQAAISAAVAAFIAQQATPLTNAVDASTNRIDAAIDRALLFHVLQALSHGALTNAEKIYARQVFRATV
ncbi:MAG: NYN domain-containing protein [Burkholderiales bacterium]|nr:NYN domain-containing protein [Burkholderiales bacterium]